MRKNGSNIIIGGLFILFGLLYLGSVLNFWPFIGFWSIGILVGSAVLAGVCLVSKNFIGGFFFLGVFISRMLDFLPYPYYDMFHISFWNIIILSVLFGVGAQILFKGTRGARRKNHHHYEGNQYYNNEQKNAYDETGNDDVIIDVEFEDTSNNCRDTNNFSNSTYNENDRIYIDNNFKEINRYVTTQAFKGGEINSSFGQVTIHLTQASLDASGAHLAVYCSFGQVEIYVPRSWAVNNKISSTIFSDLNDDRAGIMDNTLPNLTLTGNVNFGGVKILYV